jgi:hypothetical protein
LELKENGLELDNPLPEKKKNGNGKIRYNLCPVCGMYTFGFIEGCAKCMACGHSEC